MISTCGAGAKPREPAGFFRRVLKRRRLRLVMWAMRRCISAAFIVCGGFVIAGCQHKSENSQAGSAEPSARQPVGKVEMAVASAVGAGAPAAASSAGPPADGILEPARAETEAPSGQPPKLTMGSTGSEPRVSLRSAKASLPRTLKIESTLQAGMDQGLPPIEMTVGIESKAIPATGKGTGEDKVPSSGWNVTAKVRDVKVNMPNVPPDFATQLAGLKGGRITFSMTSDGGGYGFTAELAAGAKPELRDLLETVSEALSLMTMPVPREKVGNGAFWMVVSRDKSAGFGLVTYHMIKLARVDEKSAQFDFDSRRYAIGRIIDPVMLPPGSEPASLQEMSAGAKGRIDIATDSMLPTDVEAQAMLRGTLASSQGAPPRSVQSGTSYRITAVR